MAHFVDISNQEEIKQLFEQLKPNTPAQFGIMGPAHMVEHLLATLRISNQKLIIGLKVDEDRAQKIKFFTLQTDREIRPGFQSPLILDGKLAELEFENLDSAIQQLLKEVEVFHELFREKPELKSIHPAMGEFNYEEWVIFHNKHFTHHLKQFGIQKMES